MKKGILIGFALSVIYLFPSLLSNRLYFIGDFATIFYPYKIFAKECVVKGIFPLWNPYIHNGTSFLGNLQSQVLYPFSVIFYIFSFSFGSKLFLLVHLFLLFTGFFLLSRNLFQALVFTFSGFLLSRMQFLSVFSSLSLIPYLFLTYRSRIFPIFIMIFILAGYPHIILVSSVLFLFFHFNRKTLSGFLKGTVLALVLIFPFIHTYLNSAMFKSPEIFVRFYFKIENIINLFIPYSKIEETTWVKEIYVSIIPIFLFIKGFRNSKLPEKILFFTGLGVLLFNLPFLPLRYSSHLFFISLFVISIVSGREWLKLKLSFKILFFFLSLFLLFLEGNRLFPLIDKKTFFKKPEIVDYIDRKHLGLLSPAVRHYGMTTFFSESLQKRFFQKKESLYPNFNILWHIKLINGDDALRPYKEQKFITEIGNLDFDKAVDRIKKRGIKFLITYFKVKNKNLISSTKKILPHIYYFKWNGIKHSSKMSFIKKHRKIFIIGLWISILTIIVLFKKIIIV